ncbi:hypothetical protein FWC31_02900 [Candidatus Saccharibacteria bacterium]|nr:hypothetical protein [Candidatus Saccharibacteria bacterium]
MDRAQIIEGLEKQNRDFTKALLEELENQKFNFPEINKIHKNHLDKKLIVRHALPFCITERTFFGEPANVDFFTNIILLHTLALTRIDDYYDGKNDNIKVENLAYALSVTHTAISKIVGSDFTNKQMKDLIDITKFVHARMFKDSLERYDEKFLHNPRKNLNSYLTSPKSRIFASGYWEVMARASFVSRGKNFPWVLHSLNEKLRKLRQVVDEYFDVEEDLRGGLVTLPTLYVLANSERSNEFKEQIIEFWHGGSEPILSEFLEETNVKDWMKNLAKNIYSSAITELKLIEKDAGYKNLFDYKLAKII